MARVRLGRFEAEKEGLPRICMVCGAPASMHKKKLFAWHPQWVWVLFFAGLLPLIFVAMILTKRMVIAVPLCHAHRHHWLRRTAVTLGGLIGILAAGFAGLFIAERVGVPDFGGTLCVSLFGLIVIWLIVAAVVDSRTIRPVEITDHSVTLAGVSPAFVNALTSFREEDQSRDLPNFPDPDGQFFGRP